ncbi:hypothetical protein GGR56DRAFT_665947 [Xylariaceae sp. FL0804]|nr:hypothetical protein GGR56DRAFT_665947 [Xylariaceae sp. FL0804]
MPLSLVHISAWSQHRSPNPSPRPTISHLRSLSSMSHSAISSRSMSPAKSPSPANVAEIMFSPDATTFPTPSPKRMPSSQALMDDADHSTLPDPRIRALSPVNGPSTPIHHPDLDQEVATLSTKLINAINHQTSLDDTLSATRQELDASKEKIKELEALVARQQETLSGDVWIKRKSAESEKSKLLARVVEEKRLRAEVEKDKKKIEQELETLTVSLFEEANKMVYTAKEDAKKDHDILQRKNDQLKTQLSDTEGLLKFQQDQLTELKIVMEQMTADRDDHSGTAPSSPGFSKFDSRDDETQISEGGSQAAVLASFTPTYPTNIPHLVQPVLRTDVASYDDFVLLVKTAKAASRVSSGSYSGHNPLLSLASHGASSAPSNASTTSLSTAGTLASANASPQTPNTPASLITNGSTPASSPLPALKETKFYKRVLVEDIEPTLRLDIAPGLSWLARRSVLSAISEGGLVVEPVPTNSPFASISKPQFYPCSLCGNTRKEPEQLRNHRFRTSESATAQRYPLCKFCLHRVRSTCDFLGFLRMVKDGHWRTDDANAERAAWEESVRLRDQMFWSRIGGGVIPAHSASAGEKSARPSHEEKRLSQDGTKMDATKAPSTSDEEDPKHLEDSTTTDAHEPTSLEVKSICVPTENENTEQRKDHGQRLSLTIPGAFDDESP